MAGSDPADGSSTPHASAMDLGLPAARLAHRFLQGIASFLQDTRVVFKISTSQSAGLASRISAQRALD